MLRTDLAIIGGGPVGIALAAAVCSHPLSKSLSVTLIDPTPPSPDFDLHPTARTTTLTPSSQRFLQDVGIWSQIPQSRIASFKQMFVWDRPEGFSRLPQHDDRSLYGTLLFDAEDIGEDVQGYVVDHGTLRTAGYRALQQLTSTSSLQILTTRVDSLSSPNGTASEDVKWPQLHLEDGTAISARLCAIADGPRSKMRTLLDAEWYSKQYDQNAVIANVHVKDPTGVAYQRFVSTGPVALLPVASEQTEFPLCNLIWSTTPAEATALTSCSDEEFIEEVNEVIHGKDNISTPFRKQGSANFGLSARPQPTPPFATHLSSERYRIPLSVGHTPQYVLPSKRSVLLGDAAHVIHPLAGLGGNLGLADAETLASCISEAASVGRDIGGEGGAPLASYEWRRMMGNTTALFGIHSIKKIFEGAGGVGSTRRIGMALLSEWPSWRKFVLRTMR